MMTSNQGKWLGAVLVCLSPLLASAQVDDGQGNEWLPVTVTRNVSWDQVAQVCPVDGTSLCSGLLGTTNLGTWIWATEAQVRELYSDYAPAILTVPSLSGGAYFAPAVGFLDKYGATLTTVSTYHTSGWGGGWTSSTDWAGLARGGGVGYSQPPFDGQIGLGSVSKGDVSPYRGVYLWRQAGSGLPSGIAQPVVARSDDGTASPYAGVTAVANVLGNDTLGPAAATLSNVTLSMLSSTNAGVTLDVSDGSVDVAPGTPRGNYSLWYRICEAALPANCGQSIVNVAVAARFIDAVADSTRGSSKTGGIVANVLGNDQLGNASATPANVTLSLVTNPPQGISLNLATGAVVVAPKTPYGVYSFEYRICETADPLNCDSATVTVELSGRT